MCCMDENLNLYKTIPTAKIFNSVCPLLYCEGVRWRLKITNGFLLLCGESRYNKIGNKVQSTKYVARRKIYENQTLNLI